MDQIVMPFMYAKGREGRRTALKRGRGEHSIVGPGLKEGKETFFIGYPCHSFASFFLLLSLHLLDPLYLASTYSTDSFRLDLLTSGTIKRYQCKPRFFCSFPSSSHHFLLPPSYSSSIASEADCWNSTDILYHLPTLLVSQREHVK